MHIYLRRTLLLLLPLVAIVGGAIGYLTYSSGYFADDSVFSTDAGAIGGYDPVAYIMSEAAIPGSPDYTAEYAGAIWRFASAANRALFVATPERYVPQYGGYCAYAMSEGYTAYSDPTAWHVAEGRLFLNYSHDVRAEWETDRAVRVSRADVHWQQRAAKASSHE